MATYPTFPLPFPIPFLPPYPFHRRRVTMTKKAFQLGSTATAAALLVLNAAFATCADIPTSLNIVNAQISPDGYSRV